MTALQFRLNGAPRTVEGLSPSITVLDWLRDHARLTGTKEGCAEGDCGACTIAVARQGQPFRTANSCLMALPQLAGADVLTVEGLSAGDRPHGVQAALVETDGTQCGFCTPGFVMSLFVLGQDGTAASDAEIHDALAGNLCRCTGYRSIVDACRAALARTEETGPAPAPTGAAATRYEADGQAFLAPETCAALFDAFDAHPDAILLGGGTDLGLRLSKDRMRFPAVISTAALAELRSVTAEPDALVIGGAATYTDALPALRQHFPAFADLVRRLGSRQIRNLGTPAGNLANASPIGDTIPCLIALGASVTLRSREGSREMAVEDFVLGYRKTALRRHEIIAAIRIPYLAADARFAAYKLSKRFDQDISTVVGAFALTLSDGHVGDIRIAFGGMAAKAQRAAAAERHLAGRPWTPDSLADIDRVVAADFTPLSDHRGSADYRLRAAANLVRRFQAETASGVPVRLEAL